MVCLWVSGNKIPESADVRRKLNPSILGKLLGDGFAKTKPHRTWKDVAWMCVRTPTGGATFLGKHGFYGTNQVSGEFACIYNNC